MAAAIQTPRGDIVELDDRELRRLLSLARYGLEQKKTLKLPLYTVEARLNTILNDHRLKF